MPCESSPFRPLERAARAAATRRQRLDDARRCLARRLIERRLPPFSREAAHYAVPSPPLRRAAARSAPVRYQPRDRSHSVAIDIQDLMTRRGVLRFGSISRTRNCSIAAQLPAFDDSRQHCTSTSFSESRARPHADRAASAPRRRGPFGSSSRALVLSNFRCVHDAADGQRPAPQTAQDRAGTDR